MGPQKRTRSTNYTQQEKDLLLDCIKPFIHIVECGVTTKKSNERKDEAWSAIEQNFNAQNDTKRDAKSLKNNYIHIKMLVKKELVSGGENGSPKIHPNSSKLLAMLGHQVEPMINLYDSSSEYNHTSNTNSNHSIKCDPEVEEEVIKLKREKYVKQNLLLEKQIQLAELDLQIKTSQLKYEEARLKLLLDNKVQ